MDDIKLLALLHLAEAFAAGDISRDQYMSAIAKLHEEEGTRSLTKSWSAHDDDMIPLSQVGRHNFMDKSWSFLNTFSVSNRTFSIAKAFEFVDDLDDLLMLKASGKGLPVGEKWQSATGRWWVKEQRGNEIRTVRTKAPEVKGPAPTTPQGQSGTAAAPKPRAKRKATPVVGPPKPRAKPKSISPDEVNSFISRVRGGSLAEGKVHEELAAMSQASINAIKATAKTRISGKKVYQAMELAKRLLASVEVSKPKAEAIVKAPARSDLFANITVGRSDYFAKMEEFDKAKKEQLQRYNIDLTPEFPSWGEQEDARYELKTLEALAKRQKNLTPEQNQELNQLKQRFERVSAQYQLNSKTDIFSWHKALVDFVSKSGDQDLINNIKDDFRLSCFNYFKGYGVDDDEAEQITTEISNEFDSSPNLEAIAFKKGKQIIQRQARELLDNYIQEYGVTLEPNDNLYLEIEDIGAGPLNLESYRKKVVESMKEKTAPAKPQEQESATKQTLPPVAPIRKEELQNLHRSRYKDGSEGDIPGYDISFNYAGRKFEYNCYYSRYVLQEVRDGLRFDVDNDKMTYRWVTRDPDNPSTERLSSDPPPTDKQIKEQGLAVSSKKAQGVIYHVAEKPLDEAARKLINSQHILDQAASRKPRY